MNEHPTNRMPRTILLGWTAILALLVPACTSQDHDPSDHNHDAGAEHQHGGDGESWAITAWGEHFEIFAEMDPLMVGETSSSHTHVTALADFSPVIEGVVTVVLERSGQPAAEFRKDEILRAGIFLMDVIAPEPGEHTLTFRVEAGGLEEEIAGTVVRVGTPEEPGELVAVPEVVPGSGGEPEDFLKEQQWRTAFATGWVQRGRLPQAVRGLGRVRSVAGGEVVLTAPLDATVLREPWPFPGLEVARGDTLLRLAPRLAADRSLAELRGDVAALESEVDVVGKRRRRLEELLAVEAVSRRELEEVAGKLTRLEARLEAAREDLAMARSTRQGTSTAEVLAVKAAFDGRIASIEVSPGQAVAGGERLGRLVKTDPVWVEVALRPAEATRVDRNPAGLVLRAAGREAVSFNSGEVRLVAQAPEVDSRTGTVAVLLEVPGEGTGPGRLHLGDAVEAQILLDAELEGIVVPTSALVDDAGVAVVYLQLGGESFQRQEIRVLSRREAEALVEGLRVAQRLVTLGGSAIRRSTLMASGEAHGHVH
ncbi:MAG: HlyD family efflux transporter periplasmic adaptor subunit [bacterium]|nr:HlyD family efflux transporter periplasmic adaptor subunit [bacterium]